MDGRERLLRAVRLQVPDKVPVTLAYGHIDDLCRRRGKPEYIGKLRQDQRTVTFHMREADVSRFSGYIRDADPSLHFDEWGIGERRSSTGASASHVHPLAYVTSVHEINAFPLPDLRENWRHEDLENQIQAVHAQGVAAVGQMSQTIFELAWLMRGMEAFFVDLHDNVELATTLLDRITALRCYQARRLAEAGVDVFGVIILNPIQPEAMDPVALKREYGHKLAFWGTIGTQTTLPFGTPDDVRDAVRHMVKTVGAGGGLVLAPTHSVEDDVPWANILAFYKAAEAYGSYA